MQSKTIIKLHKRKIQHLKEITEKHAYTFSHLKDSIKLLLAPEVPDMGYHLSITEELHRLLCDNSCLIHSGIATSVEKRACLKMFFTDILSGLGYF